MDFYREVRSIKLSVGDYLHVKSAGRNERQCHGIVNRLFYASNTTEAINYIELSIIHLDPLDALDQPEYEMWSFFPDCFLLVDHRPIDP